MGRAFATNCLGSGGILVDVAKDSKAIADAAHYPSGSLKYKGSRLDGEMHGAWEFYRADGSVMRAGEFDRGKQVGVWRTLDRSGRVVKETDFSKRR
jgi:antitoxin component YwqK of YwqJK toxin-antitoxin module